MELNEQALEKILNRQRDEYQQYMGAQIEDVRSDIRLLAETVVGVREDVTEIREMVAKNTEDIEVMKMELSIIRNDLKEKVGREEFAVLEARVARLERSGRARQ